MNFELSEAVRKAKEAVTASQYHDLSTGDRKRVLRAFGPVQRDGYWAILNPGHVRRTRLCISVVRRVLPIWEEEDDTQDAHHILDLADRYLRGDIAREVLRKDTQDLITGLETMYGPDIQRAWKVGRATAAAGLVALHDEILEPNDFVSEAELEEPQDPDHFDCALWAAAAESNGFWLHDEFDADRSLAFWTWYLDTAVPIFLAKSAMLLGSASEVREIYSRRSLRASKPLGAPLIRTRSRGR